MLPHHRPSADVVVHLSEAAPPRSLCGTQEADAPVEMPAAPNAAQGAPMTQQQLNEFILGCSKGVGSLVNLIEEEMEKLPEGTQAQDEIESELRYLAHENELAAEELKRLVAAVHHVRKATREEYRAAATEGANITID